MRKFLLLIGDLAILYVSLYITLAIRYGADFRLQIHDHILPFSIVFIFWITVFYISGLYDLDQTKNNVSFYRTLAYSIAVNATFAIAFFYLIPFSAIAPKTNFFIFLIVVLAILIPWRWSFNKILSKSGSGDNTLIIGSSPQSQELYDFLLANPQHGYNVLGILDINEKEAISIMEKLVVQKNVKTLVLSSESYKIQDITNILYGLLHLKITFYNLPDFYEQVAGKIPLEAIDQGWFINNLSEGNKRLFEMTNRVLDIVLSSILGLIFSLIFIPTAIAIKSNSKGPIFIKQNRVGKAGKIFKLVKFRSMIANAPDGSAEGTTGAVWTQQNDPRITKIGNFLRKTRIDEIPQFWNVLKGDLSFVGPRSERPEFHEQLKKEIPFYEERYLIKPGITGWSQLKFGYGATVKDAQEKLKYDLYYIKNRSIFLNLGIILKTLNLVARKAGR